MNERASRLKEARKAVGFKRAGDAAESLGVPYPTYAAHENGSRAYDNDAAAHYARRYRVSLDWLLTGKGPSQLPEKMVQIVGKAGAGPDGTVLFADSDGYFGEVPAPIGSTDTTAALEVQGESMHGLANDGWLIFYDDPVPPSEDHMGEPCVCWLEDSRVLVKIPQPTKNPGLFNLESVNAPTMRDVAVRAFALVTDIKPRRSAQKFIRRNPDHPVQNVKLAG